MAIKNKNDDRLLDHLLHVWVFGIALIFASLFCVFVTTVFGIFAPLLPSLLAVGAVAGVSLFVFASMEISASLSSLNTKKM